MKRIVPNVRRFWATARSELAALYAGDPVIVRILVVFACVQVVAMTWDMPASYGWENDGAAPRDLFGGIAENLRPGHAHRYPLFHYLVLGLLASPVLLLDLVLALLTGHPPSDVVVSVPSMTAIALISKTLNVTMMCVALLALARVCRTCFSPMAARWAVIFAATNLSVSYYGRATNMDGPYLMWTALAIDRLLLLARSGKREDYGWFAGFLAAGVATKDQAYASFVLTLPLYLVLLPLLAKNGLAAGRQHWAFSARAAAVATATYVVLSGTLFNPTGFPVRVAQLTGSNSQDWKTYESSVFGWWQNLSDILSKQDEYWWPWPVVLFAWVGVAWSLFAPAREFACARAWRLLPLCAGLSSLVGFALVVGRDAHRFVLPLGFWLACYAGAAAGALLERLRSSWRRAAFVLVSVLTGFGISQSLELVVTQWCDPRKDVERFLQAQPPGTRVETYGLGVYLPRFDVSSTSPYTVTHLRAEKKDRPPLIPGLQAAVDSYANVHTRAPDILVIPEAFADRFLERSQGKHRTERKAIEKYTRAAGALEFFRRAAKNDLPGYRRVPVGNVVLPAWYAKLGGRAVPVHGSTARSVWVLTRSARVKLPAEAAR
ncbi:MAG TPA: hypothetical protein VFU02_12970 [Polyangiaceae bacterium]|nr:hypothetical protein [Polyangiaceae bacterium]